MSTTTMSKLIFTGPYRICIFSLLLLTLSGGCSTLRSTKPLQPSFYSLNSASTTIHQTAPDTAPILIINPPHASSGFDTQRIVYVREAHKLEYYAHNEWIDTPARMLAPLIINAVENSGKFRAVVLTPSAAAGDLRLDSEIIRLQHEFGDGPSRAHFTLRVYMVNNITRQVVGWKEFDETVPVLSESPYGGVVAANHAVQTVLEQLADFCIDMAGDYASMIRVSNRTGDDP